MTSITDTMRHVLPSCKRDCEPYSMSTFTMSTTFSSQSIPQPLPRRSLPSMTTFPNACCLRATPGIYTPPGLVSSSGENSMSARFPSSEVTFMVRLAKKTVAVLKSKVNKGFTVIRLNLIWDTLRKRAAARVRGARYELTEKCKLTQKNYRDLHRERINAYVRKNYLENGGKQWTKNNPEKRRASARKYAAKLRKTPEGRINNRMSLAIGMALNGTKGKRTWESLVGYTVSDLRRHLESYFQPGMSWKRLLLGQIHIDHVIPKSKFRYSSTEDNIDFKRC